MNTRCGLLAFVLSLGLHAVLFGLLLFWPFVAPFFQDASHTEATFALAYGDSPFEGIALGVLEGELATFRHDLSKPPGPEMQAETPAANEKPEPPAAAADVRMIEPPATPPEVIGPEAVPVPAAPELPREQQRVEKVIVPGPVTSGGARKDEAPGGSKLAQGTPALGGTPGVSGGVRARGLPVPFYPLEARRRGIQGRVLVRVLVASDGRVREAKIEQSSGYQILDDAALQYTQSLKLIPAYKGSTPVEASATLPVRYSLSD